MAKKTTAAKATTKAAAPKRKPGRPTLYSPELAEKICTQLAQGNSLRAVCLQPGMPDRETVFTWLFRHEEFLGQYRAAREAQVHLYEDEMVEIADDGTNDWMERKNKDGEIVGYSLNGEAVARSKLRVEQRRWVLERMQPKRFGSKVDVNHGVQPDNPLADLIKQVSGKTLKPGDV